MKKPSGTILWLLVISLLLPLGTMPAVARAEVIQNGPNLYTAGILTDQFQYFAAPEGQGRQRSANWCWAACIQMVLNYKGLYISQENIVAKVYGQLIDQPANAEQIVGALNGWAPAAGGSFAAVVADPYNISGPALVNDLANRYPLIIGLKGDPIGHAYVLTAVTYELDNQYQPVFRSAILRNPWPQSPSREEMSWNEFMSRIMFATRIHILRL